MINVNIKIYYNKHVGNVSVNNVSAYYFESHSDN